MWFRTSMRCVPLLALIIITVEAGLLRVPKIYNTVITSDANLEPSRAYPIVQPVLTVGVQPVVAAAAVPAVEDHRSQPAAYYPVAVGGLYPFLTGTNTLYPSSILYQPAYGAAPHSIYTASKSGFADAPSAVQQQPHPMPQPQFMPQPQVKPQQAQPQFVPQPQVQPQPQFVPQPQVQPQPQFMPQSQFHPSPQQSNQFELPPELQPQLQPPTQRPAQFNPPESQFQPQSQIMPDQPTKIPAMPAADVLNHRTKNPEIPDVPPPPLPVSVKKKM